MNKEEFYSHLKNELNIDLSVSQNEKLDEFANLLLEYNKHTNITAIKDLEGIYLKHYYDSLTLKRVIDLNKPQEVLDVGSGGGFPGIVLGLVFPNLKVTLLDSNHKKSDFQKLIINKLNLNNIQSINDRAESFFQKGNKYDLVVARAVANLIVLSELCIPFVTNNGFFVAMKGEVSSELEESRYAIDFLGGKITLVDRFNLPILGDSRALIVIEKTKQSPTGYPRSYDRIIKKPLKNNKK